MKSLSLSFAYYTPINGLLAAVLLGGFVQRAPLSVGSGVIQKIEDAPRATVIVKTIVQEKFSDFLLKGSGVLIGPDGLIATNYHNVLQPERIEVTLFDGRIYRAAVVAVDSCTDLALLKIDAVALPYFQTGDSPGLQIGETVFAVGNPNGLNFSLTSGVVGAFDRQIRAIPNRSRIEHFIQTDVPLNPGCSGGPLLNQRGQLAGINTAIVTKSGRFEGYSFAVPVETVVELVERYVVQKKIEE